MGAYGAMMTYFVSYLFIGYCIFITSFIVFPFSYSFSYISLSLIFTFDFDFPFSFIFCLCEFSPTKNYRFPTKRCYCCHFNL